MREGEKSLTSQTSTAEMTSSSCRKEAKGAICAIQYINEQDLQWLDEEESNETNVPSLSVTTATQVLIALSSLHTYILNI